MTQTGTCFTCGITERVTQHGLMFHHIWNREQCRGGGRPPGEVLVEDLRIIVDLLPVRHADGVAVVRLEDLNAALDMVSRPDMAAANSRTPEGHDA